MNRPLNRPQPSEFNEYYNTYVSKVGAGEILEIMADELGHTLHLLSAIDPAKAEYRYAPGKWTLGEVVGHMVDTERMFGFRAFWIARGAGSDLPGMDQDDFARESLAAERTLASWLGEFENLRRSHLALFASFSEEIGLRKGIASDCEFTVRSFPYIMAGHEIHHRRVIEERYLV